MQKRIPGKALGSLLFTEAVYIVTIYSAVGTEGERAEDSTEAEEEKYTGNVRGSSPANEFIAYCRTFDNVALYIANNRRQRAPRVRRVYAGSPVLRLPRMVI